MKLARGLARNTAAFATSRSVAIRPHGFFASAVLNRSDHEYRAGVGFLDPGSAASTVRTVCNHVDLELVPTTSCSF